MASELFKSWLAKFRATGDSCPVKLGFRREELKAVLGEPDATGAISRKHKSSAIWKYDELEFHFGPKDSDVLSLIYYIWKPRRV